MKLISIGKAARLLGVAPSTLRRRESADGQWVEIYGHRIRVYRLDLSRDAQRRYDEEEILRLLAKLQRPEGLPKE